MAIGSMTTAHPTVARRASFREAAGFPAPEPPRKKSMTVGEAREFNAARRWAMAAARTPATAKPAAPAGRLFQRNWGYSRSSLAGGARPRSAYKIGRAHV